MLPVIVTCRLGFRQHGSSSSSGNISVGKGVQNPLSGRYVSLVPLHFVSIIIIIIINIIVIIVVVVFVSLREGLQTVLLCWLHHIGARESSSSSSASSSSSSWLSSSSSLSCYPGRVRRPFCCAGYILLVHLSHHHHHHHHHHHGHHYHHHGHHYHRRCHVTQGGSADSFVGLVTSYWCT